MPNIDFSKADRASDRAAAEQARANAETQRVAAQARVEARLRALGLDPEDVKAWLDR